MKLSLGCGIGVNKGYINIDCDTKEEILARYPGHNIPDDIEIYNLDIFHLPYDEGTIEEVYANSLLEHLSFAEEPKFLYEVKRVLQPGGKFIFTVPDFNDIMNKWQKAEDNWMDFYRNDNEAITKLHWFGNYSYTTNNKWGYLTCSIYGTQNGKGQFHQNCYTRGKIKAMLKFAGFEVEDISEYKWRGDRELMLLVKAVKP